MQDKVILANHQPIMNMNTTKKLPSMERKGKKG
jgi:hypothetical protein